MTQSWTGRSGSRWEPENRQEPETGADLEADLRAGERPVRRQRRSPVLVALVALLSLGAVSAGAHEVTTKAREQGTSVGTQAQRPGARGGPTGQGGHEQGRAHDADHGRGGLGASEDEGTARPGAPS